MPGSKEQVELTLKLDKLEQKIQQLKSEYELFFLGFVRIEPVDKREELKLFIKSIEGLNMVNPVHKFKFQTLRNRFNSLLLRWSRIIKEIEDGRYRPHRLRSKIRGHLGKDIKKEEDIDSMALRIYEDFIEKKRRLDQTTDGISLERIKKLLRYQIPKIKREFKCDDINFHVIEDEGNLKIKATPIFKEKDKPENSKDN